MMSAVIAVRNLGGLASPAAARVAERKGRRWTMVLATASVAVGCALTVVTGSFVIAAAGIILVGLAKPAFDIAMQAWFGDRVPYSDRGRVFGITELTWSAALVVAVLPAGFLIELTDWRAPFVLVVVFATVGTVAILSGIGSDAPHAHVGGAFKLSSATLYVLVAAFMFSVAAEIPFNVYGQWLEVSFGLSVAGIGIFTLVVVAAEVVGEGIVVAVSDRWGLRNMVLGGLLTSAVAYLGFGLTGSSLPRAAVVVVIWIVAFEVTIVAAIPFASELTVEARERVLALFAVMISLGRAAGALVAQPIYAEGGIGLVGLASAGCVLVAAIMMGRVAEHAARAGARPSAS